MARTNLRVFTAFNSIAIRIANDAENHKESNVFEGMKEEKRVVGGINHVLEQDKGQSTIQEYKHTPPMMCCHYWEITLLDGQKVVLRYCTDEEKVFIIVENEFVDQGYVSRLSAAIPVLAHPCDKCK